MNGRAATYEVPYEPGVPPDDGPDMQDYGLLFNQNAGWSRNFDSAELQLVETRGNIAVKLWWPTWPFPVVLLTVLRWAVSYECRILIFGSVLMNLILVCGVKDVT